MLLSPPSRNTLLIVVWAAAPAGVFFNPGLDHLAALAAHPALPADGPGAALGWLGEFWVNASLPAFVLIALGGLVYTGGAVVYALKRPDPSPRYFGYHEIFHACTIVAAICHFIAIAMVTLG